MESINMFIKVKVFFFFLSVYKANDAVALTSSVCSNLMHCLCRIFYFQTMFLRV